jgi:hypothetical protein
MFFPSHVAVFPSLFCVVSPGFLPRVIKVAPACAIMISSYEFGKAFFQEMNLRDKRRP